MTELSLKGIRLQINGAPILRGVSASVASNELVAIVGPNGAGKTSLMLCALGFLTPDTGAVTLNGAPLADLPPLERARLLSYLPQRRPVAWPLRVRDIVALGRYAYGAALARPKDHDAARIDAAIEACGLRHLADRRADTLSGGELARVHCARAFAGGAPFLLADEPTAALDPHHRLRIMSTIRRYTDGGGGALVILHDIAIAATFADRMIWMKAGEIVADGSPQETLTPARMRTVFNVNARIDFAEDGPAIALSSPPQGRMP